MLRSNLRDFRDAYIVVEEKFNASFNPRKNDYGNNGFTNAFLPNRIFPPGSAAE